MARAIRFSLADTGWWFVMIKAKSGPKILPFSINRNNLSKAVLVMSPYRQSLMTPRVVCTTKVLISFYVAARIPEFS